MCPVLHIDLALFWRLVFFSSIKIQEAGNNTSTILPTGSMTLFHKGTFGIHNHPMYIRAIHVDLKAIFCSVFYATAVLRSLISFDLILLAIGFKGSIPYNCLQSTFNTM